MKKQEAIQKIQRQIDAIASFRSNPVQNERFSNWVRDTKILISDIFPNRLEQISIFSNIRYGPSLSIGSESQIRRAAHFIVKVNEAETVLKSFISEINEHWVDSSSTQVVARERPGNQLYQKPDLKLIWIDIKATYRMSKKAFGRKINFVTDKNKRRIIFRDVAHAHYLAKSGVSKSAVILAGGVIEELLRLYLEANGVSAKEESFKSYVSACRSNGLLKSVISDLSNVAREFRNLVHLKREVDEKDAISQATAIGTVTIIFTLSNDFG